MRLVRALSPRALLLAGILLAFGMHAPLFSEMRKVSLQLRWDNQFQFAGYYAADWLGYYRDEGLEVDIRPAVQGSLIKNATTEVSEDRADFGIGAADILMAIDKGDRLWILSSFFQKSATAVYALHSTPLDSPGDLAKLSIARIPGDLMDIEFQAVFRAEGISPDTIDFRQQESGIEHLRSGRVDAVMGYTISFPFLLDRENLSYSILKPNQFGVNFYGDALFTSETFLKRNRAEVDAFVRASIKGWEYALNHPDEIAERIVGELPRTAFIIDPLDFNRFQAKSVIELMEFPIVEPGHTNTARWQLMYDWLLDVGVVSRQRNVQNFIYLASEYSASRNRRLLFLVTTVFLVVLFLGLLSAIWIFFLRRQVSTSIAELRVTLDDLKKAQSYAKVGSWTWEIAQDRVKWSDEMYRLFGIDKEIFSGVLSEVMSKAIHPEDRPLVEASNRSVAEKGVPIPLDYRIILPNGQERIVHGEAGAMEKDSRGKPIRLSGYVQDISERKQAEEKLTQALCERETLLRELYHRTKNNLFLISALLEFRAQGITDAGTKAYFKEMQSRIEAMALIHDMLYRTSNLAEIDLGDYLGRLAQKHILAAGSTSRSIDLILDMKTCRLPIDIAVPLAIVVNEILLNTFKHAFPGNRSGSIRLSVSSTSEDIHILIADDGIGFPPDFSVESTTSMGMVLMRSIITEQLLGTIVFDGSQGLAVGIKIPAVSSKQSGDSGSGDEKKIIEG